MNQINIFKNLTSFLLFMIVVLGSSKAYSSLGYPSSLQYEIDRIREMAPGSQTVFRFPEGNSISGDIVKRVLSELSRGALQDLLPKMKGLSFGPVNNSTYNGFSAIPEELFHPSFLNFKFLDLVAISLDKLPHKMMQFSNLVKLRLPYRAQLREDSIGVYTREMLSFFDKIQECLGCSKELIAKIRALQLADSEARAKHVEETPDRLRASLIELEATDKELNAKIKEATDRGFPSLAEGFLATKMENITLMEGIRALLGSFSEIQARMGADYHDQRREYVESQRAHQPCLAASATVTLSVKDFVASAAYTACDSCAEAYQEGDKVVELSCGHAYHLSCAQAYAQAREDEHRTKTCPNCGGIIE